MLKICRIFLVFSLLLASTSHAAIPQSDLLEKRVIEFTYSAEVPAVKPGKGPVHIFIPLAETDQNQKILSRKIHSPILGVIKKEGVYGNTFWHATVEHTDGKPVPISVRYSVERKLFQGFVDPQAGDLNREEIEKYLQPNSRVPVRGALIEKIRAELPNKGESPQDRAHVIYDYVVDNMEYKKVGTGWGNGDTYWACSKKYGNCTDFHALFISLARAEQIPSRFEIGFPIPTDKVEGKIGGYHCWVTFFLPQKGWVPIDASEAKKHPEKRELLFGTHPADRIYFTRGRDLKLGEGHTSTPLNYFIYPHVEISGKAVPKVKTEFLYKVVS